MNALEKHVLQIIGENTDSPDVFLNTDAGMAPVRDSINDAIQELCMVTGSYRKTYLLPLYADRQFYRMAWEADHFGYVVEAWDRSRNRRLVHTDLANLNAQDNMWMKHTGTPDSYLQIGEDIIGFYRKPASEGVVLELTCVCVPKPYTTDTAPVKLREQFERAAVYYAVCDYFASRGDARRALEFFERYTETAGIMTLHPQAAEKQNQFGGNRYERNDNARRTG
jgi:hypothetical protein